MVSEAFKTAVWRYRQRGGKLYRLALDHGMSPSVLSATLSGVRRVRDDKRLVSIGAQLGLSVTEVFESDDQVVAS